MAVAHPDHDQVLIIGAGIGGLALAQGLKKLGIGFSIAEKDVSARSRSQGFRFRLQAMGWRGLSTCLTPSQLKIVEELFPESSTSGYKINAITGALQDAVFPLARSGGDESAYTVDRALLKEFLADGLSDNIFYGKTFRRYSVTSSGVQAFFEDGTSMAGILLVGADGVHSKVAQQTIPSRRLLDNDGRFITGRTMLTNDLRRRSPVMVDRSCLFTDPHSQSQQTPLILVTDPVRFSQSAQSFTDAGPLQDYIYWVLVSRSETFGETAEAWDRLSSAEAADLSLKITSHWDSGVTSVLELQERGSTRALKVTSDAPDIFEWQTSGRVTLLGDAVHAVTPARGLGSNLAIRDAAAMVDIIAAGGINCSAVATYEHNMRDTAASAILHGLRECELTLKHLSLEECHCVE
ncbi:hypothetical protein M409DRAFT_71589 [Zasmidium cellare ATCC 36951]|uniref:FAD-binding domain-containing protein n=1 Tax=Zasmidium cellare ATCC 36951 TaxID=1080233 RepID=A0A6A6BUS7_ZASCE|nr:uncharacterized protein M409DRAFT_71589 [Zasmidium cellare ATCC 36951]KAF2158547.1 hypothetical protein M409DRAFT_71589 [Zasmidium cellare ATCC 36951]